MAKHSASRPSVRTDARRSAGPMRAPILVAALAALLAVGGTLAWVVDRDDPIANAFEPTEVTCQVTETMEGNVKSDVKVENTGDSAAYVRVAVIANWVNPGTGAVLGTAPEAGEDYSIAYAAAGSGWGQAADGYWYWCEPVAAGSSTEAALISSCAPLKAAPEEGYVLSVDVVCSAIQAEPVDAVTEAWASGVSGVASDGLLKLKNA